MAKVGIFVGTMYGTAQGLAEAFASALQQEGHQAEVFDNPQFDDFVAYQNDIAMIVTSTTGQGELPDGLVPLYEELRSRFPLLTNMHYAVAALGDSSYGDHRFCGGGRLFDTLMLELTATPLHDRLDVDACETFEPEEAGLPWLKSVVEKLAVIS
ncbi:flavodoxin [Thaumasiovibrio subtropicus]|uniref:flavodoxin n=1 Tax=Thaumasiovibrio subtropicus TaxID=1891207 RepID=UPI000B3565E2|nr:flavodoxin [Thaumasiovibrio subtropicus]